MKYLLFTFYFCLINGCIFAQKQPIITIADDSKTISIGQSISFLEDTSGLLEINDIQKPEIQAKFVVSKEEVPNFGASSSTFWVKITISNLLKQECLLELAQANLYFVDFYKPVYQGFKVVQTGCQRPFENREVISNFFLFRILPNLSHQPQTYYLKVKDHYTTLPLYLGSASAIHHRNFKFNLFYGIYIGMLSIMFFYNLFLFFRLKEKIYMVYVVYLFSTMSVMLYNNINYTLFFIRETALVEFIYFISLNLFYFSICYFSSLFLELKQKYFFSYQIIKIAPLIYSLASILARTNFFSLFFNNLAHYIYMGSYLYLVYLGFISSKNGSLDKKLYFYAFSFYLTSLIIFMSTFHNYLPLNWFTENVAYFGQMVEIALFSLALSDKINLLKREKILAQAENIRLIEEQKNTLADKVAEKTLFLEEKTKDLLVSNEELHQSQEEIIAQRDLLESKNILLEEYNTQINKSIQAAELIQQATLPSREKMKELFEEYFVIFKPKDIVSGDFWWADNLEIENTTKKLKILILADCTGHGVAGAMLTMIGATLLDRIIRLTNIYKPAEILEKLHLEIQKLLNQRRIKDSEGMDISVVCWQEEEKNCLLSFAAAKQSLYYVLEGKICKIAGTRRSIGGLLQIKANFENHELVLPKNTLIYLSSDGYVDQNNIERRSFMERNLLYLLQEVLHLPLKEQKAILTQTLATHMKGVPQRDDISMIGIKI